MSQDKRTSLIHHPYVPPAGFEAMAPGVHRMELRHDDFFSSYLELDLKRAERRKVTLALAPVLP